MENVYWCYRFCKLLALASISKPLTLFSPNFYQTCMFCQIVQMRNFFEKQWYNLLLIWLKTPKISCKLSNTIGFYYCFNNFVNNRSNDSSTVENLLSFNEICLEILNITFKETTRKYIFKNYGGCEEFCFWYCLFLFFS